MTKYLKTFQTPSFHEGSGWGVLTRSDIQSIREENERYKNYDYEYDIYLFGFLLVKGIKQN